MTKLLRATLVLLALALAALGAKAQSLSASPASLFSGQSSTAAWSGIATPSSTDWIGLYVPGSGDGAFVSWRYTDGNAAGSVPFLIPVGTAAGTYELRLYANNGFALLATSSSFSVNTPPPATISASPASLLAGQSTTANWTNIVAPSTKDWIGLYLPGADNTASISWRYTDGNAAGSVPFQIPYGTAAGTYELRLFSNDTFTLLATGNSITVTTGPAMTLSASPTSLQAGQSTTATWANISAPSVKDWIGLYVPGSDNSAAISWRYTDGSASGNVSYQIPFGTAAGTYELRLFSDDTFTLLTTSSSITVTASAPITLSASPSTALQGQQSTATWANITAPSTKDWIGLYLPGAADTAFVSWRYTDGNAAGSVQFDIPASVANGTYQLRLFSNDTFTRLATSNNFSVGVLTLHYIEVDHLNAPRAIFDANQNLKWRWDQQEPFGVNAPDENPSALGAFEFPVRFPGQYADKETNLNYNYFRDYDSGLGRYLQSDQIGLKGGANTYVYVAGGPLRNIDPNGLVKWTGTSYTITGAGALGGSLEWFDLSSACINGKYAFVRVFASALVTGYGVKVTGGAGGVEFEDGDIDINTEVFTGTFRFFSVGAGVGVVGSYSYIQLGGAFSVPKLGPPSPSIGVDASATASIYGRSAVVSRDVKPCSRCGQR